MSDELIPQTAPRPLPTEPVIDGSHAAFESARARAIAKLAPPPAPVPAATPAEPTTAKVDMDPATLKQLTKQAAALRRAEQRVVELEAGAKDVGPLAEAKKLYASGKRLEAIALLSGNDASTEMEALMGAFLETTPPAPVDPAAAKLAELEAWKTEQIKAQEEAKVAAEADRIKHRDAGLQGFAWSVLDAEKLADGSPKFELCSLTKNRGEAAVAALRLVSQVYGPKEHPNGDITPDQARALYARAFAEVEVEYRKNFAEQYGFEYARPRVPKPLPVGHAAPAAPRQATTATTPAEPTRANQSPTLSRPAISTTTYPRSLTHREALAKAIERIKSLQG